MARQGHEVTLTAPVAGYVREAGRSTQGVKLLNLEEEDKVAAAVVIPPEEAKIEPENGTLLQ